MAVSDQSVATRYRNSISCVSTPFARFRWMRCRRRTPAIRARPWRLAPVAYCLWQQFLRYDPEDPIWPNRDRFVLSNGHASMLLYSLLHLAGVREVNPEGEVLATPPCRSTTSRISANWAARRPAIPNTA